MAILICFFFYESLYITDIVFRLQLNMRKLFELMNDINFVACCYENLDESIGFLDNPQEGFQHIAPLLRIDFIQDINTYNALRVDVNNLYEQVFTLS